uniref:DEK-C domain-containing protein n=1 Tax=Opuntia streptacantha TaxID=393608 RepID=A0A7C8YGZ0_OPUST
MAEGEAKLSEEASDMESKIKDAMFSRASYFRDQADSLTLEKVRRLLEKDLGLETYALDVHKRFVKNWLEPCIESAGSGKLSKNQDDAGENAVSSAEGEVDPMDEVQMKKEAEEPNSGSGEKMEDSPVMGLMTGPKKIKNDTGDTKSNAVPSESTIKKAIWARASYLRENSQNVTLAGVRRLLEEDLELEKHSLDSLKKFINQQVDEVMESPDVPQTTASQKKKGLKKGGTEKTSSVSREEGAPPSSESEGDELEEDEVKVRKKSAPKGKLQKADAVKKRKRAEEGTKGTRKKQSKVSKSTSEGNSEEKGGDVSGDDKSDASAEKPVKKKETPKTGYGKKVEHLKSVIKSCGMSVPPSVYKRVKQAPEDKREACLIKELEEILAKEGLSTNPSEKEIKEVKKRKERARELEGIDLSNIVSSSRRRSTSSFTPPPKPKIPEISESESEESENEEDGVEEDEEVEDDEAVEEDQENGGNNSQSEESEEDNDDSD